MKVVIQMWDGTGLDASVGDGTLAINVAAAQTSITSIINSSLGKIGTSTKSILLLEVPTKLIHILIIQKD